MASTLALTVGGDTFQILRDSLRINESANRPGTCSFDVRMTDASALIALDDEVILTEDVGAGAVRIFGGLIDAPPYAGLGGIGGTQVVIKCSAVDFNVLIDRRVLNIFVPDGSLEDAIDDLVAYLADYGVTKDAGQVTGPTLLGQHFYFMTLRRAFQLLSDQTDYLVNVDYNKSLRMALPSATACPFDITTGNRKALGDITVEPTREDFANRILVLGGTGTMPVTDAFVGDGSTDAFVLNYTLAISAGYVTNGGIFETLDVPGNGATWEHTTTGGTTTITNVVAPPANLAAISINYTAYFPKLVVAGDDPPLWTVSTLVERLIPYPDVFDVEVLQELADKWVARTSIERKRVTYFTREVGVHPGQTQTITVPERDLSGTFTITDVEVSILGGSHLVRKVTALEGDTYLANSWQDDVATWGKYAGTGGSGQAAMTAGTVSVPTGAAPPLEAFQFNRNGALGGSAGAIYKEAGSSPVFGDGSSITAADFDSCFIAGLDCHITD
jgi:hypothetical protein